MTHPSCTYLLPLRRTQFCEEEAADLREYFKLLASLKCEVIVIDGSGSLVFNAYDAAWSGVCRHLTVDPRFGYLNGKVNGVHTGLQHASGDKIILADDDIRYTPTSVTALLKLLDRFEVIRPQNFLRPLPWWAKMESARMLINRATLRIADYPGTCCFRRDAMVRAGHYDGDVLFDNEEIIRHFAQSGASIHYATNFFVLKRPPRFRKWLEQRPRQAYEDFGLRAKTSFFLALLPLGLLLATLLGWRGIVPYVVALAIGSVSLAFMGRIRGRAARYFPLSSCFFAPLWVVERALSSYWAVYYHLVHGGYPFGEQLLTKGIGRDWFQGGRIASRQLRESS
jgi:glycosyltransferase involved in cell wall biosynthesis